MKWRDRMWLEGRCIECGKAPLKGRVRCFKHLLKASIKARKFYSPRGLAR